MKMGQKDRLLIFEFLCAFFLSVFVIALFGKSLAGYNTFLVAGLACGFIFSWLNREKNGPWPKIFVTFGVVCIFGWMVYAVINSSLYYKVVILLCIRAALLLEAVVSFNASNPSLLSQMEALTVPLCMGFPIFCEEYSSNTFFLIGGYFFTWLVLLRVKFYLRFPAQRKNLSARLQNNLLAAGIFVVATIGAWALYTALPLEQLKVRGIFQQKSKTGLDIDPEILEKDYYGLQEKITKMIVDRHIPRLTTSEDRHEAIQFLESLIRELPDTYEVDKAEQGLNSQFKLPGPGEEKGSGEDVTMLNKYVKAKDEVNLDRLKENVLDSFKNNPFDIKSRVRALDDTNKIRSASSFEETRRNKEKLEKAIERSSISPEQKSQASSFSKQMRSWKDFGLYREKREKLQKKIAALKEINWRDELAWIAEAIEKMQKVIEFEQIKAKIKSLEALTPPENIKEMLNDLKGLLYVKLAMLPEHDAKIIKVEAEKEHITGDVLIKFEGTIDVLVASRQPQEMIDSYKSLQETAKTNQINAVSDNRELARAKTENMIKDERDRVKDTLGTATPRDLADNFLKELEGVEDNEQEAQIVASFQYLNGYREQLSNSGFVSGENQKDLKTAMEHLEELYIFRLKLKEESGLDEAERVKEEKQKESSEKEQAANPQEQVNNPQENEQGTSENEQEQKREKKLIQIKILPERLELALGQERQFVAMGTYSDNSQEEVTDKAEWQCSDETVAKVLLGKASTLHTGTAQITAGIEKIVSKPATLVVKEAELLAIMIPFKFIRLPLWGKFKLKAEGFYTDYTHKDITGLVNWNLAPERIARVKEAMLSGMKLGKAWVSAEYKGIKSNEVSVQVILTLWVVLFVVSLVTFYFALAFSLLFLVFFALARRREKKILSLARQNPKEAVILVYKNALEILFLFEPRQKGFSAPLSIARRIENKFGIKDAVFYKLSVKYNEARYSKHDFQLSDAQEAIKLHNAFLIRISREQNLIKLAIKKAAVIIKRRPFFIHF